MKHGYRRTEELTDDLSNLLMELLNKYPEMRLGQLIVNVCGELDAPILDENGIRVNDFSNQLFNIRDEVLLRRLYLFDEWRSDEENKLPLTDYIKSREQ
jgi:hypothetical protein